MKKYQALLLFTIYLSDKCVAQFSTAEKNKGTVTQFYGDFAVGGGFKGLTVSLGVTASMQGKWGIRYSYTENIYPSLNRPDDYKAGGNLFASDTDYPRDQSSIHALQIMKELLPKSKKLRYAIFVGPSLTFHRIHQYKSIRPDVGYFSWSGNYELSIKKKALPGVFIKTGIAYVATWAFGMHISAVANINAYHNYAGLEAGIYFGKLAEERNKTAFKEVILP